MLLLPRSEVVFMFSLPKNFLNRQNSPDFLCLGQDYRDYANRTSSGTKLSSAFTFTEENQCTCLQSRKKIFTSVIIFASIKSY